MYDQDACSVACGRLGSPLVSKAAALVILPAETCSAQCTISGARVSPMTVGTAAPFVITARDVFGNARTQVAAMQ
jgi:hypothetical protein